jgi:hypothetical protein
MENKDIKKNIGLTFDFVRELIAHPEKAEELPDQAEIEFIEKDFEERQIQEADKKVLVKVKNTFEVVESSKQKSPAPNKS